MKKLAIILLLILLEINISIAENQTIVLNMTVNVTELNLSLTDNNCSVSINITINQTLYENNEKIYFYNLLSNNSFGYKIEYWIEDLFERIIKKKINTTNQNKKSFTPKIGEEDKILIIKNRIVSLNCSNTNNNVSSQRIILIKNKIIEQTLCETSSKKSTVSSCKPEIIIQKAESIENNGKLVSFYTRTKNFYDRIKLYAKIEGKGFYTLRLNSFNETINKNILLNGSKTFTFNVSTARGKNVYFLELYKENKISDFKKLEINFGLPEKKNTTKTTPKNVNFEGKTMREKNKMANITGKVIYESEGEIKKKKTIYFVVLPFLVLLVILINKKRKTSSFRLRM